MALLSACGTLSSMELDSTKDSASYKSAPLDLNAEVDSLVNPIIERGETPGMIVGVLTPDGKLHFFGYGTKGGAQKEEPDADTVFPVGSLSKGFLGAITASLVKAGVISWQDNLEDLLSSNTRMSNDAKKITLLQLATHTSGLPRQPHTVQTLSGLAWYAFTGESFYQHIDTEYALNYLSDFSVPQDKDFLYSNIGYGYLGHIVERRSGKKLEELLRERITQPLAMRNTGYNLELMNNIENRAYGHAGDQPKLVLRGRAVPDWRFTEFMKGSAAMYSSARDLLIFASAHLDSDSSTNHAFKDTLRVRMQREKESPAIAWFVDDVEGQYIRYQVGIVAGYTSYLGINAEQRIAVVVLQNSFNWNNRVGHKLLNRLALANTKT